MKHMLSYCSVDNEPIECIWGGLFFKRLLKSKRLSIVCCYLWLRVSEQVTSLSPLLQGYPIYRVALLSYSVDGRTVSKSLDSLVIHVRQIMRKENGFFFRLSEMEAWNNE